MGKIIVITGVTRGLGRALADWYMANGHTVVGCGRGQQIIDMRFDCPAPNDFSVERRGKDKYGRTVGIVYSEGEDVGGRLVREGYAKPWPKLRAYDRPRWCGE